MARFAVLDSSNSVVNIILADDLQHAQSLTNQTCVECDGSSVIGSTWDGKVFIAPKPWPSWTLVNKVWTPPTPMPNDGETYVWWEPSQSWHKFDQPPADALAALNETKNS